jgi:hypothetical protein
VGRPTDYTPELADRIAQFVRAGNWPDAAAVAAGVSERSFYRWMARGLAAERAAQEGLFVEASEEPYWHFWQQIKRAEGESEALAVGSLMKAIPHTPSAAMAWLERRFRKRWGRSERIEHVGEGGGPIQIESPAARIRAQADEIAKRLLAPLASDGADEQPR